MKSLTLTLFLILMMCTSTWSASAPPLSHRWIYLQTSLLPQDHFNQTLTLLERVAAEGYNGVVLVDYKFMRWDTTPVGYRRNWQTLRDTCTRLKLELIAGVMPMGYSNSLLSRDPNLAEGLPVRNAPFRVRGGRLVPDEAVPLLNGGFEAFRGNQPDGWSSVDGPGAIAFRDTAVRFAGNSSLRMQEVGRYEPKTRHARVMQRLTLAPFRYYHISAMVRTLNWDGDDNRIMVLGEGKRNLTFQTITLDRTQDWKRLDITFNTLDNATITLYLGTWAGNTGTLWWDDVRIEPAGFMNILRRSGTPLTITSEDGKTIYEEGRDFTAVSDPKMGKDPWAGDYTAWHEAPVVSLPPASRLREGQSVLASYYHPAIIYEGQLTCCLNDPGVYDILAEQARQVRDAIHPDGYMMSHDEIRVQGWDESCVRSGMTPAQSLADNIRRCTQILHQTDPGKALYVWSDMFDPNHNARKTGTYYLVKGKGPWYGSESGLSPDVTILNWQMNPGTRRATVQHFADLGNHQILAGYYDGNPALIADWLDAARGIRGVDGIMYTTWHGNYSHTKTFLQAAGFTSP